MAALRDCLAGLAAPHRAGIARGDRRPANVLLRRAGSATPLDVGPAVGLRGHLPRRTWSPAYPAPVVEEGVGNPPRSDAASRDQPPMFPVGSVKGSGLPSCR